MILFIVTREGSKTHVLTSGKDREEAKKKAQKTLGRDPEKYTVTPLTEPGDKVHFVI